MAPRFMTTGEAGRELGISPGRVRQLVQEGRLRGVKVGRDWLIRTPLKDPRKPEGRAAAHTCEACGKPSSLENRVRQYRSGWFHMDCLLRRT